MKTDGTGLRNLTKTPDVVDAFLAFTPDGQKVAFESQGAGAIPDIFRMRADGTHLVDLTKTSDGRDLEPDWQPIR